MFDQDTLNEVIRRIVEIAEPERIMLFGSAARADMTRHSDLDLLIIKEGGDARDLMGQIYERLYGVGAAVDNACDRACIAGRLEDAPTGMEQVRGKESVTHRALLSVLGCSLPGLYESEVWTGRAQFGGQLRGNLHDGLGEVG